MFTPPRGRLNTPPLPRTSHQRRQRNTNAAACYAGRPRVTPGTYNPLCGGRLTTGGVTGLFGGGGNAKQPLVFAGHGGVVLTTRVKLCTAFGATPLEAVKTSGNVPAAVGVPESTPVAALNVTPAGSAPVIDKPGAGLPVAVTVKLPPT